MIGSTLNGRFTLEKELGRGGMGAVYRATDSILQRSVAIKVLKDLSGDEVGRKIRLEAQILARLVHHNVVRLYDFSADGETYYFIMEEVDGTSFARRIKKITLPERLEIVAQTAEALDYAHHQGVIHRDVKPANVLLTSSDVAKLSDFGLSLLSDAAQDSGVVRGTPHYMSPEQAKARKIDHRTDLYALGVILYECATGTPPFVGPVMTVMAQHINADPEPPRERNPGIGEGLEALILALMEKNPAARPGSGREVAERVRALIPESSGGTAAEVLTPRANSAGASVGRSAGTDASAAPSMRASAGSDASRAPSLAAPSLRQAVKQAPGRALAQTLVDAITLEPILLTPDERYYHGHYLAYLLGGSRRRGFLLRRPLDPLNADRARLILAMTALTLEDSEGITMGQVASILDDRPDVRPLLSPVVVAKYLTARSTPARRKKFRQTRQQLQQASEYASRHMTDEAGILNPGLMPQNLNDLRKLAPQRTEVDDLLVERWNRVTGLWLEKPAFRQSVLRYATKTAAKDPASLDLWPEVVYPLIERARRQRQLRSGTEAFRDVIFGSLLHLGDAGVQLDQQIRKSVPVEVVRDLDVEIAQIVDEMVLEEAPAPPEVTAEQEGLKLAEPLGAASFHDLEVDQPTRSFVRLIKADPLRQTLGDLRSLGQEAIAALKAGPGGSINQRHIPLGLYRLVAIPSIRSRAAGQVAIQGMVNKQIELMVPPFQAGGLTSMVILAVWLYSNNSMAVTYLDNLRNQKYLIWDATVAQQTNFDDPAHFNSTLYNLGLEVPDQLDRVLTKSYKPHGTS